LLQTPPQVLHSALDPLGLILATRARMLGRFFPHAAELLLDPAALFLHAIRDAFSFARRHRPYIGTFAVATRRRHGALTVTARRHWPLAFAIAAGCRRTVALATFCGGTIAITTLRGGSVSIATLAFARRGTISLLFAARIGAISLTTLGGGTVFLSWLVVGRCDVGRTEHGQQQAAGQRLPPGTGKDAFHRRFSRESSLGSGPGGGNQRDGHQSRRARMTDAPQSCRPRPMAPGRQRHQVADALPQRGAEAASFDR
jgi:hypothetical protein